MRVSGFSSGSGRLNILAISWAISAAMTLRAEAESPAGPPPPLVASPSTDTEFGFSVFQKNCTACHGNPAVERAPSPSQLRQYSPERIYAALTTGPMKTVGDTLAESEKRQVAASLAGRPFGVLAESGADHMPNKCAVNLPMMDLARSPRWSSWGNDQNNSRFQPHTALSPSNVGSLKFKWAFGFPNSTSAYSQPAVAAGRVFVGSDTGYIYSLDAVTGCVYWSFASDAGVRNAMTVAPSAGGQHPVVYYGDLKANVYALDAQTGRLIWRRKVDPHYTDRITAAPAYSQGVLYVPVSSWEEFAASSPDYPCCTSVGSVVALNARTGRTLWKTYAIAQRPAPVRKNSRGVQQWAPAGASVWNTPTLDPKRHRLYVGTGDATTYPAPETSDAVVALDLRSGKLLWSYQVFKNDSFLGSCPAVDKPENCPRVQGPDFDIPAPPILRTTSEGDQVIVATKPGDILALRPADGRLVWRKSVFDRVVGDSAEGTSDGQPRPAPGIQWGGTSDGTTAYYGLSGGGLVAIRMQDGVRLWVSSLGAPSGENSNNGAAATGVPGMIFAGGSDGNLTAVSSSSGDVLWQFGTRREFDAVNHVPTRGGSIYASGPVVAGNMVFAGSGYAVYAGTPGNALIAFGLD